MSIFASWPHRWFFVPNTLSEKTSVGYPLSAWVDPAWRPDDLPRLLSYLASAPVYTYTFVTDVKCAVCGIEFDGSSIMRWDGTWLWGDEDRHFVETHSVRLPDRMVEHIRQREYTCPPADECDQELAAKTYAEFFDSLSE
jgi:hypothetical protein